MLESTLALNLRRLLAVRVVLLAAVAGLLLFVDQVLDISLPLLPPGLIMLAALALTALSWWWVERHPAQLRDSALCLQLFIDIATLTGLLYFTGGWTNPLVSLYLIPVAVAAALLRTGPTWLVAGACVLAYTAVARFHQPVLHIHGSGSDFALHVTGMWLTFVASTILLAYFGNSFATTLRRRDRALTEARETNLRNEQIMGVATLAAGTAHELSTPLSSITVIASELESIAAEPLRAELRELSQQVGVCRDILGRLRDAAAAAPSRQSCRTFLGDIVERFQLLRPAALLRAGLPDATAADAPIDVDPTLAQAVLNLLDNAANASPGKVELASRCRDDHLEFDILDRGAGIDDRLAADPRTADREAGMGMGLMLANATIERRGGTVFASARDGGGTRVHVKLPLVHRAAEPRP